MINLIEEVLNLKDYELKKYITSIKDFSDSLLEIGKLINPSNPYDFIADKFEDMSKWGKKDWEMLFKHSLSFKDIRDAQITFEELSKQIRDIAKSYSESS